MLETHPTILFSDYTTWWIRIVVLLLLLPTSVLTVHFSSSDPHLYDQLIGIATE